MTGEDLRMLLSKLARWDPKFREDLIRDPKSLIERQFDISLGDVTVKSVVETPDTIYVVVPPDTQPNGGEELTNGDLQQVSGGTTLPVATNFGGARGSTLDRLAQGAGMSRDWESHLFPKITI